MPATPTTVSLVLGSGGARGLAHIGVINWLTANQFAIKSIAGSSMGALIGGIYAAGQLETYTRWVTALRRSDILRLLDFAFERNGLFKGERLMTTLRTLVGERRIEDLAIKFAAVATDIDAEKEVWFTRGPLFDVVRASIAIPTLFTPYRLGNTLLVDGGLINPLPIAATLGDDTDMTIVVNLTGTPQAAPSKIQRAEPGASGTEGYRSRIRHFLDDMQAKFGAVEPDGVGFIDLITKSMDIMQHTITEGLLKAYDPDVVIDIPRNACAFYEFDRAKELIDLGYQRAGETLAQRGAAHRYE